MFSSIIDNFSDQEQNSKIQQEVIIDRIYLQRIQLKVSHHGIEIDDQIHKPI